MSRYAWLENEVRRVPRKKFYKIEARCHTDLAEVEARYGPLPRDYVDFVDEFGQASLFRASDAPWHYLAVMVPPEVRLGEAAPKRGRDSATRLRIGHFINTGYAWFEWQNGSLVEDGAVFLGLSGQRRKGAASFEQWLKEKFAACRKFYSRDEWQNILTPVPPFNFQEQQILEAMPKFKLSKAGVTSEGDVLVAVENNSLLSVRYLTVGVRDGTLTGSSKLPAADIRPGTSKTIRSKMYKGSMDPHKIELFRLPLPDPEDRPYYGEFRTTDIEGLPSRTANPPNIREAT
ncbi:MAG: hypothetical protein U1F83_17930 [Verrucomicrobiota bacterium]